MNDWIKYEEDGVTIELGGLLSLLLHSIGFIVGITVAFAVAFLMYSKMCITPLYKSSILMYVNNWVDDGNTSYITSSDIYASQDLVDTYAIVLKSKPTLEAVIEKTGVSYTVDELKGMISTSAIDDTEVFKVVVTSADPQEAADVANAIAEVAPDEIMKIIVGSSAKIIEYAEPAISKSYPSNKKYALIGMMLGLLLSTSIVVIRSVLKSGRGVEDKLQSEFKETPVLVSVPELSEDRGKKRQLPVQIKKELSFSASESYKLLRTNLSFCFADNKESHVIGITSSIRGEAKTTTAIYLAQSLAQAGRRVCLVDCDLRLPSISKKLEVKKTPGLVNYLVGHSAEEEVIKSFDLGDASFSIITSGDSAPNPSELLGSAKMTELLENLGQKYEYVLLDLPPVGVVSDALTLSKCIDGMLFAVREDFYDRRMVRRSLQMLKVVETHVLGFIITHSTDEQQKNYPYYRKKYGKGYGYGGYYGYADQED